MLSSILQSLIAVKKAEDEQTKEAIFKLRYNIYVNELKKKNIANIDHKNKQVVDQEDKFSGCSLFYTGNRSSPSGAFRIVTYEYDKLPKNTKEKFSLNIFPELSGYKICEVGRLIINPKYRGSLLMLSMVFTIFKHAVQMGNIGGLLYCSPGLAKLYKKFGYRAYAGNLIATEDGIKLPMIFINNDLEYLNYVGSPLYSLAKKLYKKQQMVDFDYNKIQDRMGDGLSSLNFDQQQVWQSLEEEFLSFQTSQTANIIFENLTIKQIKELSDNGFILEVNSGDKLISQGLSEQEMYVVTHGSFEVISKDGVRLCVLGKGELFGEIAFFSNKGQRTASVVACEDSKVFVISRNYIKKTMQSNQDLAIKLLYNIAKIQSLRLAKASN